MNHSAELFNNNPGLPGNAQHPGLVYHLPQDGLDEPKRQSKRRKVDTADQTRRMSHNSAEKRRRDKINESIEDLRMIVPGEEEGKRSTNKAIILKRAVEYLKELEHLNQRLIQEHHSLLSENEQLKHLRGVHNGATLRSSGINAEYGE
eukprot:TRINITY_DN6222_c0_g1_i3.p2 TRINITY_DN6222_c0_g1~~TRINITY_DN6222_c0_g1_i3.p2  ORF type:complete len:148 (-),score=31.75 TRINITY_DN6222_c0_g1_i3:905-1348(-)